MCLLPMEVFSMIGKTLIPGQRTIPHKNEIFDCNNTGMKGEHHDGIDTERAPWH